LFREIGSSEKECALRQANLVYDTAARRRRSRLVEGTLTSGAAQVPSGPLTSRERQLAKSGASARREGERGRKPGGPAAHATRATMPTERSD
jgi:hypothetical protein